MEKTKQTPADDVETQDDPTTVPAAALAAKATTDAKNQGGAKAGLRSQGNVGKVDPPQPPEAKKPAAQASTDAAPTKTVAASDGPGNLRSQGAVALTKKAGNPAFSNVHMRSTLAKKAETSTEETSEVAAAAPETGPASTGSSKDPSASAPNASDLDATLPETKPTPATNPSVVPPGAAPLPSKGELAASTAKPSDAKTNARKDAPLAVPKPSTQTQDAATANVPKAGGNSETSAPTISLKVAVQMDDATLVMNPKSKVKLDDEAAVVTPEPEEKTGKAAAVKAPLPDAKVGPAAPIDPKATGKGAKAARAIGPTVEIKKDKVAHTASPEPAVDTVQTISPNAPKVEVTSAKKDVVEAKPALPGPTEEETPLGDEDRSDAKGDDLQDEAERNQQPASLSERRHRRTRELKSHREAKADPPA